MRLIRAMSMTVAGIVSPHAWIISPFVLDKRAVAPTLIGIVALFVWFALGTQSALLLVLLAIIYIIGGISSLPMRTRKALALAFAGIALYLVLTVALNLLLMLEVLGLTPPVYGSVALLMPAPAMSIPQIILPVVIVVWKRQAIYSILRVD